MITTRTIAPRTNRPDTTDWAPDKGCYLHQSCSSCPYDLCLLEEVQPSKRASYITNTPAPAAEPPEPEPEPHYRPWKRTAAWEAQHHIPHTCPHCGGIAAGNGFPDEVFCRSCHSSSILSWVKLPRGWKPPYIAKSHKYVGWIPPHIVSTPVQ